MFSGKILRLLLFVLLSLTTLLFVGCNAVHLEKSDVIVISRNSRVCIVYGSKASDYVIKNAKSLGNSLKEHTGASVSVRSDWKFSEKNDLGSDEQSTVIILYGKTDQELSRNCYEDLPNDGSEGYTINTSGNHIVISATTEKMLLSAGERIVSGYIKNKILEMPCDTSIESTTQTFFCIADRNKTIADFIINDGVGKNTESLTRLAVQMIAKKSGLTANVYKQSEYIPSGNNQIVISLEKTGENYNSVKPDAEQTSQSKTSSIGLEDNRLIISGSDEVSLQSAISSFIGEAIINCDRREDGCSLIYFPKDKSVNYSWNYPLPIIPVCTLEKNTVSDIGEMCFEFSGANAQVYSSYSEILQKIDFLILDIQSDDECEMTAFLKSNMTVNMLYYKNSSKITVTIVNA